MSYKVGQFKRTDITDYVKEDIKSTLSYGVDSFIEQTPYGTNSRDGMIKGKFLKDTIYHIRCVAKVTGETGTYKSLKQFKLKLKDNEIKYQSLKIVLLNSSMVTVDVIFIPQYDFEGLVFEAIRDASLINDKNAYVYCSSITKAEILTNVIDKINGATTLKKIGIQGPEGLTFAINGEMIKMGKGGIFISQEMEIASLAFIIEKIDAKDEDGNPIRYEDGLAFFILDYQY